MVLLNYATKEIVAKIVYYGPGLCGKTTNLQMVYAKLNPKKRGKMISLATEADRTLFFDFLPMELGTVQGFKVRFQLYTVPGQVFYGATRKLVLKGADAVVFVADSQEDVLDKNIESLEDMKQNLIENNLDPEVIPIVFQWNKRDLPAVMSVEDLNEHLNWRNLPNIEGVAVDGTGVVETFREITRLLIMDLKRKHSFMDTDKIKDLPPEIFETKKDEPVEEPVYEIELGSYIRDGSEDDVVAGELLEQIETIAANDYQEAEAFFDNVRKGSTAEEAKAGLKVGQKRAIELSSGLADDMVIERISIDRDPLRAGERELTPDELEADEPMPEAVLFAEPEAAPPAKPVPDVVPPPPPPPPSMEYMLGLDNDYRKVMDPDHGVSEPSATRPRPEPPAPPSPPPAIEREKTPVPAPAPPQAARKAPAAPAAKAAPPAAPPTAPPVAKAAPPMAPPATVAAPVDISPLLAAVERLGTKLDMAPLLSAVKGLEARSDTSAILAALKALQGEVASLKDAVSQAQGSYVSPGADPFGAPDGPTADIAPLMENLHKEFMAAMEGQDRLMLSILEAVREGRKHNADAHETIEHGLKYISDRLRDISKEDDKGGKKKWF